VLKKSLFVSSSRCRAWRFGREGLLGPERIQPAPFPTTLSVHRRPESEISQLSGNFTDSAFSIFSTQSNQTGVLPAPPRQKSKSAPQIQNPSPFSPDTRLAPLASGPHPGLSAHGPVRNAPQRRCARGCLLQGRTPRRLIEDAAADAHSVMGNDTPRLSNACPNGISNFAGRVRS
jgi:hypothetical protein